MKRLIALRRLKNHCGCCNKTILKGEVYYKHRLIYADDDVVFGFNLYYCAKHAYYQKQHEKRYKEFQKKCTHPYEFIKTEWCYIPGETVLEPNYDYCILCGKKLI